MNKKRVLVLGSTGQVGGLVANKLDAMDDNIEVVISSRRQTQVDAWRAEGHNAVLLDLDEPRTFGPALAGIDSVFLLTGYTVDMLVQSKTLTDAAVKAGVEHMVHWGVFNNDDVTDPHFAWHQMVETYIAASGLSWTNLHPNYFMENLINVTPINEGRFSIYSGDACWGWIALEDAAEVAAVVLRDGATKHHGKDYWLSTESLNGTEAAEVLTEALDTPIHCDIRPASELEAFFNSGAVDVEPKYAASGVEVMRQIQDGRMAYLGTVRDDVPHITGHAAMTLAQWAQKNRSALLKTQE